MTTSSPHRDGAECPNGKGWRDPQPDATVISRRLGRGTHCLERPQRQLLANLIQHGYNSVRPWDQGQTVLCIFCGTATGTLMPMPIMQDK